ncbi:MAG: toll/interleukin-1 receptor domain-containing protein, partial [Scytonema sp. RU_4_4]|nr:toll/interleukin-1 receptor domain-containing protein [Scytonema sp. RU_4_4]
KHLKLLERQGVIKAWYDRKITAGDEWKTEIEKQLNSAQIILLLVSADFLASDFSWSVELERAMKRHEVGEARVIPIILREVDWHEAPFAKLQALPRNAEPVTNWANRDQAFTDIAKGIRRVVEELVRTS